MWLYAITTCLTGLCYIHTALPVDPSDSGSVARSGVSVMCAVQGGLTAARTFANIAHRVNNSNMLTRVGRRLPVDIEADQTLEAAPRVSTREWVRHPGAVMDEVLRNRVVVVQSHGRDVAAVVDIEHYRQLVDRARQQTGHSS